VSFPVGKARREEHVTRSVVLDLLGDLLVLFGVAHDDEGGLVLASALKHVEGDVTADVALDSVVGIDRRIL
jgi:hypothetical protein